MSNTLSNDTEIGIVDGSATIYIYGAGDKYDLFFNTEKAGTYLTYTEALQEAISTVNKLG